MTAELILLLAVLLLVLAFLYRNNLTCNARFAVLEKWPLGRNLEIYEALPSYDAMLCRPRYWHIWTVRQWIRYAESLDV